MIRVILCDDHTLFRAGIKNMLDETRGITVVAETGTGREFLKAMEKELFDAALLDISLPDMSGLDVLKNLESSGRRMPVIVLSMHPEEQYARRALKAGAMGYLAKDTEPAELVKAIRKVAGGGRYVSATLAEKLASELSEDAGEPDCSVLSDRELEVMLLIAKGDGIKEISAAIHLSPSTVATYRARILAKLNLQNTADIVRFAMQNRLLD